MAVRNTMLGVRTIASAAADGLAGNAVHIRVYPRPRNLAESREILRVLEGYGEVVMYKHLKSAHAKTEIQTDTRFATREIKYEPRNPAPNSILAIYQASSSAQKLVNDSPFRFKIENKGTGWTYAGSEISNHVEDNHAKDVTAHSDGDVSSRPDDGSQAIEEEVEEVHGEESKQAASSITEKDNVSQDLDGSQNMGATGRQSDRSIDQMPPPKGSLTDPTILPSPATGQQPSPSSSSQLNHPRFREFGLKIVPSHMNHQSYIQRQGYYAEFMPDSKTIMAADLEDRVRLAGLMDCHVKKEEVHFRIRQRNPLPRPFSLRRLWEERDRV